MTAKQYSIFVYKTKMKTTIIYRFTGARKENVLFININLTMWSSCNHLSNCCEAFQVQEIDGLHFRMFFSFIINRNKAIMTLVALVTNESTSTCLRCNIQN